LHAPKKVELYKTNFLSGALFLKNQRLKFFALGSGLPKQRDNSKGQTNTSTDYYLLQAK
jgi:hypothetical protein